MRGKDSPAAIAEMKICRFAVQQIKNTQIGRNKTNARFMKGQMPPNNSSEPSSNISAPHRATEPNIIATTQIATPIQTPLPCLEI